MAGSDSKQPGCGWAWVPTVQSTELLNYEEKLLGHCLDGTMDLHRLIWSSRQGLLTGDLVATATGGKWLARLDRWQYRFLLGSGGRIG